MASFTLSRGIHPDTSLMVDYSRFDHIDTDNDEEEMLSSHLTKSSSPGSSSSVHNASTSSSLAQTEKLAKKGKEGRIAFEYEGRTVYEWDQSLDEVNIYIMPPDGVTAAILAISIQPTHLKVGLRGAPPFIDEELGGVIVPDDSTWTFVDGEIQIILQKMRKAEAWDCALQGRAGSSIDSFTKEEVKKKLLLERFQEEHPGFDFSNAEFNGTVPDARDFMGGVKYG